MTSMTIKCVRSGGLALCITLAACQQAEQPQRPAADKAATPLVATSDAAIKAAMEPFEAVTEQAFSATPTDLKNLIASARTAYGTIQPSLTRTQRTAAEGQLSLMLSSGSTNVDRTTTALAANDIFRQLLEVQQRPNDPAVMAGLLDYAGFRYQALAQSDPTDWKELYRATIFAKGEWRKLAPLINDAGLRNRFGASIDAMASAATVRDRAAALKAVTSELQLVDLLEKNLDAGQPNKPI